MRFGALAVLWFGLLGLGISLFAGAVWAALGLTNLKTSPAIPWSVPAMALLLWFMWRYLSGIGPPKSTAEIRRHLLRANPVSGPAFTWSLIAGFLSIAALAGYWSLLYQIVKMPGTILPDYSMYPLYTVVLGILMGSLVSPFAEESGFRGYFQVVLESRYRAPVAIAVSSAVFGLAHIPTHPWPTAIVFFLVGIVFGVTAYLTQSILPGIAVHIVGDATFFIFVWPHDSEHHLIWQGGPDSSFWLAVTQALVFTALAIAAFFRLARETHSDRQTSTATPS
jgi:membrane protease YdiL (CAAX protease family)